jgi:hypothetical protein
MSKKVKNLKKEELLIILSRLKKENQDMSMYADHLRAALKKIEDKEAKGK